MIPRAELPEALVRKYGLTPTQAAIVAKLWLARGSWVEGKDLNAATADASRQYDHAAPLRTRRAIGVHVFFLRARLGKAFVCSNRKLGYRLGAAAQAEVRELVYAW